MWPPWLRERRTGFRGKGLLFGICFVRSMSWVILEGSSWYFVVSVESVGIVRVLRSPHPGNFQTLPAEARKHRREELHEFPGSPVSPSPPPPPPRALRRSILLRRLPASPAPRVRVARADTDKHNAHGGGGGSIMNLVIWSPPRDKCFSIIPHFPML